MAPASFTIVYASTAEQIDLREADAKSRALGNVVMIATGGLMIFVGIYLLLWAIQTWTPSWDSTKMGGIGIMSIVGGMILMGFSSTSLEREQYLLSPENIVVVYRNKFKHVRKWYRIDGATGLFLELSGATARGGIIWSSGLALAFCHGDVESVAAILADAATLFNLPKWQYLVVDAPARERLFQPYLPGPALMDRDEAMRSGERLSWKAQGTEKKFAHIGRYDAPPNPEAWQDGAFHLTAYPHSFWDTATRTIRLINSAGGERLLHFDDIDAIGAFPASPQIVHAQGGETYLFYTATLVARTKTGQRHSISTLVRIELGRTGDDPAMRDARILAPRLYQITRVGAANTAAV